MSETATQIIFGDWQRLGNQLKARTVGPLKNVPFVFYVLLGPFMFGALGVWVEIIHIIISKAPPEYAALITAVSLV